MNTNRPLPRLPLHAQIRESVRARIIAGTYTQHERIPSEKGLMAEIALVCQIIRMRQRL